MTNKYTKFDSTGDGSVDASLNNPIVLDDGTEVYIQSTEPADYDVWIDTDGTAAEGIFEDTDGDGIYEQTTGDGIEVDSFRVFGDVVGDRELELADVGTGESPSKMVERHNGNIRFGDVSNDGVTPQFQYQGNTHLSFTGASTASFHGDDLDNVNSVSYEPRDVLAISSPSTGLVAYHDPSISGDGNAEGLAEYRSDGSWYSLSDGSVIS